MNTKTLGSRIHFMRTIKSMSRKELGTLVNLNNSDQRISEYENGLKFPRMPLIEKFSEVLNVSRDWLLTGNLDLYTFKSLQNEGLLLSAFENPTNYLQLLDFLTNNEKIFDSILDKEDLHGILDIILDCTLKKQGNLNNIISPSTIEEFNDYLEEKNAYLNNLKELD